MSHVHVRHLSFVLLAGLFFAAGCGGPKQYAIVGTPRAPGAEGTVSVKNIEGGNRMVSVSISHLPPPSRLGEDMSTYVVWVVPPDGKPTKAGVLEYDKESRQGNVRATTPSKRFSVKITAEKDRAVGSPGKIVVAERQTGGSP